MKPDWKKYLLYAVTIIIGGSFLFILEETIRLKNTGFETKTLWDWMELLVIPLVLALGAFALNRSEKKLERQNLEEHSKVEREVATDRQQEAALQAYLDRMADLLLTNKLQTTENAEVQNVARIRTLTVLRGLDATRKGLVLLFLHEANLITKQNPIVDLSGADLSDVDLSNASLRYVDLKDANLNNARLIRTSLRDATLSSANLKNADLSGAVLFSADLSKADLGDANLRLSNLSKADLHDANLHNVNLSGAILKDTNLRGTNLRGVNLSDIDLSHEVDLTSAILNGSNLSNANMSHAYLEHASLTDANLRGIKLHSADLSYADLRESDLSDADLTNANLLGAKVDKKQLAAVKSLNGAIMPDGTVHE